MGPHLRKLMMLLFKPVFRFDRGKKESQHISGEHSERGGFSVCWHASRFRKYFAQALMWLAPHYAHNGRDKPNPHLSQCGSLI